MPDVSEEFSKKRRGRPRRFSDAYAAFLRSNRPGGVQSERTVRNDDYYWTARTALFPPDATDWQSTPYRWLCASSESRGRKSLLTELGRLGDAEIIRQGAAVLCEEQPSAREGVLMVRRWRLGNRPPPDGLLHRELCRTLDGYISRYHPDDVPWGGLLATLDAVRSDVEAAARREAIG